MANSDSRARTIASTSALTHAEVLRRLAREIELIGTKALAAQTWEVSARLLRAVLANDRNIGPKLLKALRLRRVRLVVYRYEPDAGYRTKDKYGRQISRR